jgi:hypothetical protein
MDLIIIPFHDWRKSEKEGFRTRDVHFINALRKEKTVDKILVINRPITYLELFYKGHKRYLNGELVFRNKEFVLTQVHENVFVADFFSNDIIGQAIHKFNWFIKKYNNVKYKHFINECAKELEFESPYLITQNIFAYKLAVSLKAKSKLFDAWDNFLKFPGYKNLRKELKKGYSKSAREIVKWITNSNENIKFYKVNFGVQKIELIKNGVKIDFIGDNYEVPSDLKEIAKPWIGFGGKISYLMDVGLINYLTSKNPDLSFVFVGQILDKTVYEKITKRENVHFLGDKKYDIYPNYVRSFDICIVPYNIKGKQHGGDSMKAYEYLLANKKVVGTNGNGLEDLKENVYVVDTKREFSKEISNTENKKKPLDLNSHSWESKAKRVIYILQKNQ